MEPTRADLAHYLDHTLLKTDATADDVRRAAAEAVRLGVFALCVSPNMIPLDID